MNSAQWSITGVAIFALGGALDNAGRVWHDTMVRNVDLWAIQWPPSTWDWSYYTLPWSWIPLGIMVLGAIIVLGIYFLHRR